MQKSQVVYYEYFIIDAFIKYLFFHPKRRHVVAIHIDFLVRIVFNEE